MDKTKVEILEICKSHRWFRNRKEDDFLLDLLWEAMKRETPIEEKPVVKKKKLTRTKKSV